MDGHTYNQRLDGVDANGAINFQPGGPTVGDFHSIHLRHMCLMNLTAGLPGV